MELTQLRSIAESLLPRALELVSSWLPNGTHVSDTWRVGNIQGDSGQSLEINLKTGKWIDRGAPDGVDHSHGVDLVALYAAITGMSMSDAACTLAGIEIPKGRDPKGWKVVSPVPANAPEPTFGHYLHGQPTDGWTYQTEDGRTLGYVCRYDVEQLNEEQVPVKHKFVLPYSYCQHTDGSREWRHLSFKKPRPLYGLELISKHEPNAPVLLVEGEKACDAARELFPNLLVMTWPGGGKALKEVDWEPLRGRKVTLWPDWDLQVYKPEMKCLPSQVGTIIPLEKQPGYSTMQKVAGHIGGKNISIIPVGIDQTHCDGWDAADAKAEGMNEFEALRLLLTAVPHVPAVCLTPTSPSRLGSKQEPTAVPTEDEKNDTPDEPDDSDDGYHTKLKEKGKARGMSEECYILSGGFRCLGRKGDNHYYITKQGGFITPLTSAAHRSSALLAMDDRSYWIKKWPGTKDDSVNWEKAISAIMAVQRFMPIFSPKRIRGRGCWLEGSSVVYHAGDKIITDSSDIRLRDYSPPSGNIYVGDEEIPVDKDALTDDEVVKFVEFINTQPFTDKKMNALFGGWIALAPICGALNWRPHIWMTGGAGAGKSYQMDTIAKSVGDVASLIVAGNTSEAGIRSSLGSDAFPLVLDDVDKKGEKAFEKINAILELARIAACESSGSITKGTKEGGSTMFKVRSMFSISGINPPMQLPQDVQRFSVIESRVLNMKDHYDAAVMEASRRLKEETVGNPEYASGLRARSIRNANIISHNADIMSKVIETISGSKRVADQLGTLMAGWHSLHELLALTHEQAEAWLRTQNIEAYCTAVETHQDDCVEQQCKIHLFSAPVRMDNADGKGQINTTIGELIASSISSVAAEDKDRAVMKKTCSGELLRYGLKTERDGFGRWWLWVANRGQALEKIYNNTAWGNAGWRAQLKRLPDSTDNLIKTNEPGVVCFGTGVKSRATRIRVDYADLHDTTNEEQ